MYSPTVALVFLTAILSQMKENNIKSLQFSHLGNKELALFGFCVSTVSKILSFCVSLFRTTVSVRAMKFLSSFPLSP